MRYSENKVIHFKQNKIQTATLEEFQLSSPYIKVASAKLYFLNNCENFAIWCRSGSTFNENI